MEIYFTNTYTIPVIFISSLLAALIVFLQYRNEKDDILDKNQKLGLSFIRFIAFFLVSILLSEIALKQIIKRKSKPTVIVAVDNSESMKPLQTATDSVSLIITQSLKKNNIRYWQFGDHASEADTFLFEAKYSNYGKLLDELTKNYLNTTIGAVLLVGDGIFNQGTDPVFKSKIFPFPVYSVGIGDTTTIVDAAIKNVSHNRTAFLDNYFPVEIGIDFTLAAGNQVKLEIIKDDKAVYFKDILITSDHQFVNELISLKAEEAGINNYKLVVSGLDNEVNENNNRYEFSISVISEKQTILILGSGPHPDLAAINSSLKGNQHYSIDLQTGVKNDVSLEEYDLIIAHQIPDRSRESAALIQKVMEKRIPVLFIVGEQSSVPMLNQLQENVSLPNTTVFENTNASLNENFNLFTLHSNTEEVIEKLPPLYAPFGDITSNTNFQILAFQNIKNMTTENPLICIGAEKNHRLGFISGEGLWRWRIYDFLQNGSHEVFDDLIQRIVNYLVIKPNEDNFNIYCPEIFDENEQVILHAELYNASNELVSNPDIEIEITSEDSINYSFIFDKNNLKYRLNAGKLPVGNYSYSAKTFLANEELKKEGFFRVTVSQNELLETKANFQVLSQISNNTGGKFFASNEIDALIVEMEEAGILKPNKTEHTVFKNILDMKWLFFLIVFLFSMEWFLRKFWGTY